MERSKYILCILVCLFLGRLAVCGQSSYKQAIYNAYVKGNMLEWEGIINKMEKDNLSLESKLELLNYYYGFIGYMIGQKESKTATIYIKKGENIIEQILEDHPDHATATAFKGAFIAFKVGLNKLKAVTLGPQCIKHINRAYKLDSKNVQALADKGNMLYYAPGIFGGNKKEAVGFFERAIEQIEINDTKNNWFYLYLLTILGKYNERLGNKAEAKTLYEKVLVIEPEFQWVRDELYPALVKAE